MKLLASLASDILDIPRDVAMPNGDEFKAIVAYIAKHKDVSNFPLFAEHQSLMVEMAMNPSDDFEEMCEYFAKMLSLKDPHNDVVTKAIGYRMAQKYIEPQIKKTDRVGDDLKNLQDGIKTAEADLKRYMNSVKDV